MLCYSIVKLKKTTNKGEQNMTGLQKRRMKRTIKRFWKEWGITLNELGMLICALSLFVLPLMIRIIFAIFGI